MIDIVFYIVVGMFIGWNFPQPGYAKWFQNWVISKWEDIKNR